MIKFPHFHHPAVRDLAWAVASPPLFENGIGKKSIYFLDEEWMNDRFLRHLDWFHALDQDPKVLHKFLNDKAPQLIGKKFEALLEFWFSQSPWFELIDSNVQFTDGVRTIGEVDFLVFDKYTEELLHIEAACKYYWASSASKNWDTWLGPNRQDTLGLKMKKLRKQAQIFQTKQGIQYLENKGLDCPISVNWLKGYLFYSHDDLFSASRPLYVNPKHHAGWYVFADSLRAFEDSPSQWVILPRTHWIGPYHFENNELPILNGAELIDEVRKHLNVSTKALLVAQLFEEDGQKMEMNRGLILTS